MGSVVQFRELLRRRLHLFLLAIACVPSHGLAARSQDVELVRGWKLISAAKVSDSGAQISQPKYDDNQWFSIRQMPATVLEILQENCVYQNLYFGMNLLTRVPQDLYEQDWWYRTTFRLSNPGRTQWLDLPGINYRAEVWFNGHLIIDHSQLVGMYVSHRLNLSEFVRQGNNALAIRVTPERKVRNLNGVELADSWVSWINWKYLAYRGPFNPTYFDASQLSGVYIPDKDSPQGYTPGVQVSIAAASTDSVTLNAVVKAGDIPLSSGNVKFISYGRPIGTSAVGPGGVATITIPKHANAVLGGARVSFVGDRNAGIWKPVSLHLAGPVLLSDAYVSTKLPLPRTTPAALTVYANLTNSSSKKVLARLEGDISRPGKPTVQFKQLISLAAGEKREVAFSPEDFSQLSVHDPDLWWPYTMGQPALYSCRLAVVIDGKVSDTQSVKFGIRTVTQLRDNDEQFPKIGKGGNFYLQINGKDFLIRGGAYTPDLLYRHDPGREATAISYAKDLRLNMLRWESKISSTHIIDLADDAGIPLMFGWMCCDQWEHWEQWDAEDQSVARASLRSQILMLRTHPSVFIWSNGSDGRPPDQLRADYHRILSELHWQNAIIDTASSFAQDQNGNRLWDGIHMEGPYVWRPSSYWFSGRYGPARGANAEQGDTEIVPPYESLTKFIPADKLWPINEQWFFHAGGHTGVNELLTKQWVLKQRYGSSSNAEEFAKKAQLAAYENTRAQFEAFAAKGWMNHKMTIYWMFNTAWPSFYSGLYDYYQKPGGAYYGAKKGLRPLSVVFDSYATGDHSTAEIRVVNQTPSDEHGLRVRVRIYDLSGQMAYDRQIANVDISAGSNRVVLNLPRFTDISSVYFVRCELFPFSGDSLVDNIYWQSTTPDDVGNPSNDQDHSLQQETWADLKALNTMPKVKLRIKGSAYEQGKECRVQITLHNPTPNIGFFERAELTRDPGGNELLPITYDDNYVSVFPGESVRINGAYFLHDYGDRCQHWLSTEGYNTPKEITSIELAPGSRKAVRR